VPVLERLEVQANTLMFQLGLWKKEEEQESIVH
jgi:hypothetical protein